MDRETWRATAHGVTKSQTWLSNWTDLMYRHVTMFPVAALPILDGQAQSYQMWSSWRPSQKEHLTFSAAAANYPVLLFLPLGSLFYQAILFPNKWATQIFFEQDKILVSIKVNKTFKDPTRLWKWSRRSRHSSFILQVHQPHGPQTLNMSYQQLIYSTAHGSIRGRREACRGSSISGSSSARPRRRLHPRRNWKWWTPIPGGHDHSAFDGG